MQLIFRKLHVYITKPEDHTRNYRWISEKGTLRTVKPTRLIKTIINNRLAITKELRQAVMLKPTVQMLITRKPKALRRPFNKYLTYLGWLLTDLIPCAYLTAYHFQFIEIRDGFDEAFFQSDSDDDSDDDDLCYGDKYENLDII